MAKILDFGLAKLAGLTQLTQEGTTLGTAHYMSPEQAAGQEVDPRSDLWCLGVVLYEMITGRVPFQGDHAQAVTYAILNTDPDPVTGLRTGVPLELERIIGKCLTIDPTERYQHADDLLADLKQLTRRSSQGVTKTMVLTAGSQPGHRRWPWVFGLVVTLAVVLFLAFQQRRASHQNPVNDIPLLAVLPFENLGQEKGDLLCSGIAEALISRLARLSGVEVISRVSTRSFMNSDKAPDEIAKELGADFIIGGTVMMGLGPEEATRARVMPHLIDPQKGTEMWADTYDFLLNDVFAIHSEIAEKIAEALEITLTKADKSGYRKVPTDNLEAYEYYVRGCDYEEVLQGKNAEMAIEMFERAVALDQDFALAWAQLGKLRTWRIFIGRETKSQLPEAEAAIRKSFEISKDLPEAHTALGYFYYWGFRNYDAADEQFHLALLGQPSNVQAWQGLGLTMRRRGQWEEGLAMIKKAQRLSPLESDLSNDLVEFYVQAGNFDAALAANEQNLSKHPDIPWPFIMKAKLLIAMKGDTAAADSVLFDIYWEMSGPPHLPLYRILLDQGFVDASHIGNKNIYDPGDLLFLAQILDSGGMREQAEIAYEAARRALEEGVEQAGQKKAEFHLWLGYSYSGLGFHEKAIEEGKRGLDLMPSSVDYLSNRDLSRQMAEIYVRAGNHEAALDLLENLEGKPINLELTANFLRLDPVWAPLRDNPRFKKLIAISS